MSSLVYEWWTLPAIGSGLYRRGCRLFILGFQVRQELLRRIRDVLVIPEPLSRLLGVPHLLEALHAVLSDLEDRKSTRLNSSHDQISYAVFCLKKKKKVSFAEVLKNNHYYSIALPCHA